MKRARVVLFVIVVFFSFTVAVEAYSPWIVKEQTTTIQNPEVSQAFYGELKGVDNTFKIDAKDPFTFYVNVLVPYLPGAQKNMSAEIYAMTISVDENDPGKEIQTKRTVAILQASEYQWSKIYEPWGGDNYFKGPEYKARDVRDAAQGVFMDPGTYFIRIYNPTNQGKYMLAVGTREEFTPKEVLNMLVTLPKLRVGYWGKSPLTAFFNYTGLMLAGAIIILIAVVWSLWKFLKKKRGGEEAKKEKEEAERRRME